MYCSRLFLFVLLSVLMLPGAHAQQGQSEDDEPRRIKRLSDSMSTDSEWTPGAGGDLSARLQRKLDLGRRALDEGRLTAPASGNALRYFRDALEIDPNSADAAAGLNAVAAGLVSRAQAAVADRDESGARELLSLAESVRPGFAAARDLLAELDARGELATSLNAADQALQNEDYVTAVASYRAVLDVDRRNERAIAALATIEQQLLEPLTSALDAENILAAREAAAQLSAVLGAESVPADTEERITAIEQSQRFAEAMATLEQAEQALAVNDLGLAEQLLQQVPDELAGERKLAAIALLEDARFLAAFPVGHEFQDDPLGPMLIVIGEGSDDIGSPDNEEGRYSNEGPLQPIEISRRFAIGKYEVSVEQFKGFVDATGYVTDAERNGGSLIYDLNEGAMAAGDASWRNDYAGALADLDQPVVHVSWNDAQAYVEWLSELTGQRYRLPSEVEFEYVARAGADSAFPWGASIRRGDVPANLKGSRDRFGQWGWGADGFDGYGDRHFGTAPVGSFPANAFGAHDMVGNVGEWTADCYSKALAALPIDGSPYEPADCSRRVARGASWASSPRRSRIAQRLPANPGQAISIIGIRVVRPL